MNNIIIKVWGEYACFTRPELKSERVSYDVMTPSAARGILDAIYYKPAIRWVIDEIQVINPIKFANIRRNEVSDKISEDSIKKAISKDQAIHLDILEKRQQRASMVLKDVCYIIKAHFEMMPKQSERDNPIKHYEIFKRRASKGQCFMQPYLGCREFVAFFEWVDQIEEQPIQETKDLSYMLYDIDFNNHMTPVFFRAQMNDGVIQMPEQLKKEVNAYGT